MIMINIVYGLSNKGLGMSIYLPYNLVDYSETLGVRQWMEEKESLGQKKIKRQN
jgi:hypothetical protein